MHLTYIKHPGLALCEVNSYMYLLQMFCLVMETEFETPDCDLDRSYSSRNLVHDFLIIFNLSVKFDKICFSSLKSVQRRYLILTPDCDPDLSTRT